MLSKGEVRIVLATAVGLSQVCAAGFALAAAPTAKRFSAAAISPTEAASYYGSGTTHTNGPGAWTTSAPEIRALAIGLGKNRLPVDAVGRITAEQYTQNVFDYVRNNIQTEFRYGLGKGARGALIDQSGTPFDQAELMVKLLREAGIAANYQVGTITLNAERFGRWSGLVYDLQSNGAFKVNARAACQYLADGGIPLVIAGGSQCDNLTGDLTEVTLGHVWVSSGGKLYDPSVKSYALKAGIDVPAAMQCGTAGASTCGTHAANILVAPDAATPIAGGSAFYVANPESFKTLLGGYATALADSLLGSTPDATVEDVVGGMTPDFSYSPAVGASLPYPSTMQLSWTGDVPDAYRTSLRIRGSKAAEDRGAYLDKTFFVDELAGRRVTMMDEGSINLDNINLVGQSSCSSCIDNTVILDLDHPYASRAPGQSALGSYATEHLELELLVETGGTDGYARGSYPMTFVTALGRASASTESSISAQQEAGALGENSTYPDYNCGGGNSNETTYNVCRNEAQPTLAAKYLSQGARADKIISGLTRANITRHHDLGVIYAQPASVNSASYMSLVPGVSTTSTTFNANDGRSAFETSATAWAMIEGSVSQQSDDSDLAVIPAHGFPIAATAGYRMVQIPSSGMAGFLASNSLISTASKARLQAAANAGLDVILPERGGVEIFYNAAGTGLGYTILEAIKGGGTQTVVDPLKTAMDSTKISEQASSRRKYLAVNLASGSLNLSPDPDIVTGMGEFPIALPFQRAYKSAEVREHFVTSASNTFFSNEENTTSSSTSRAWQYAGPDNGKPQKLGGGWTHNYTVTANFMNAGDKALGSERAIDAAAAIASLTVIKDQLTVPDFQRRTASAFAVSWLADRLVYNAVIVEKGGASEAFQRLPDGTFLPSRGSAAKLVQTGQRTSRPDYTPISLAYTGKDGDTIAFSWMTQPEVVTCVSFCVTPRASGVFKADNWVFPNGVRLDFTYEFVSMKATYEPGPSATLGTVQKSYLLKSVRNNLGRSLTFTNTGVGFYANAPYAYRLSRVTDENGKYVDFDLSGCATETYFACSTFTATRPDGSVHKYSYEPGQDSPDPSVKVQNGYRLRRWYSPSSQTTPYQTVTYDDLYRVSSVKDILGHVTQYASNGVFSAAEWKRGQSISAEGSVNTTIFDRFDQQIASVDALNRETITIYDAAGRAKRRVSPEKNAEEFGYDRRGNQVWSCQIGKARYPSACDVSQGDLRSSMTYMEGETVRLCVTSATCNKPATSTDARGATTSYSWYGYGELKEILGPADSDGKQPLTTATYGDFSGTGGTTFKLLTSKVEKVSDTVNLTKTYAYDSGNKFVLKSVTSDPNGVAATVCLKFDKAGNLTGLSDPRAGVCQ